MYYSISPWADGCPNDGWAIGIAERRDLKAWIRVGEVLPDPSASYERKGICAPYVRVVNGSVHLFYAGTYNNAPKQIGVAQSTNGVKWTRVSEHPFLPVGRPGEWNSSESGHPGAFVDTGGKTYLFYQGNSDNGKTWYLSMTPIGWRGAEPFILQ
jgi:predicted GH43/DUF377 family glycosyl hydrolase